MIMKTELQIHELALGFATKAVDAAIDRGYSTAVDDIIEAFKTGYKQGLGDKEQHEIVNTNIMRKPLNRLLKKLLESVIREVVNDMIRDRIRRAKALGQVDIWYDSAKNSL